MNILNDIIEEIVDAIMPKRFKLWFFSHSWPKEPTKYDIKYLKWVLSSSRRFYRRWDLLSMEQQKEFVAMLKKL